ncbi:acyl-CoA thioesterase [Neobacillus vireti]|uniref:acyl-CoA thioesterase n=1 Tax=Neobacillus vireti TaxID=220686 RepID=UPI002FFE0FB5
MDYTEKEVVAETNQFHVSNVQLYEYLDEARTDWYKYIRIAGVEPVLVHIRVDFKKEIFSKDRLQIRTSLERVGSTSYTLKQLVLNQKDKLAASVVVVLATIEREKRTKVTVPNEIRNLQDNPFGLDLSLIK